MEPFLWETNYFLLKAATTHGTQYALVNHASQEEVLLYIKEEGEKESIVLFMTTQLVSEEVYHVLREDFEKLGLMLIDGANSGGQDIQEPWAEPAFTQQGEDLTARGQMYRNTWAAVPAAAGIEAATTTIRRFQASEFMNDNL